MIAGLKLKDFNIFSKKNELNRVETPDGTLTLLTLFIPILVELLLKNLMNTVSVYIMGRVSDDAVAAIGVGNQLLTMFVLVYNVFGTGATVVIGQNIGAGRKERANDSATAAIYMAIIMPIILAGVMMAAAEPLVRLMHLEERLVPDAAIYLKITVGFAIFHAVMTIAMAECRAFGNTLYPVIVSLVMNVINAAISYVVVFRPFETPLYGITGIAWARVIAEGICMVIILILLKKVHPELRFGNLRVLSWPILRDILVIGGPSAVQYLSYNTSQTVTTAILASLGATVLSTKIYVQNIVFYSYLLGQSLGQANGLLVGRLVGQGRYDHCKKMVFRNLIVNIVINAFFSAMLMTVRYPLLGIFTEDKTIIAAGALVMLVDIFVEVGRGMNHTFEHSLIASGDSRFPMLIMLCTTWGLSVLFSYILGVKVGLGLLGCWIAFAMDECVRGTCYILRWRSNIWQTKSLVRGKAVKR